MEVYGGAGVVSRHMSELGFCVAPVLDLSNSHHYDMSDLRLLEWSIHMIEEGRFRAFLVEPPCTSFSAAAHPSVRPYKEPLCYDRTEKKTLHGNLHAFRAFTLLRVGRRKRWPCGLEQPRLSKMAWLTFWQTLLALGFVASCQFGSLHREEFRFLVFLLDVVFLEARCHGGHHHVRIDGKWIKGSAVYTDGLGKHLAAAFAKALRLGFAEDEDVVHGFESLVVNDFMESSHWTLGKVWDWKKHAHINVYETDASVVALESSSCRLHHYRACFVVDSLVAKGAPSKGRSSAKKLQPALKRACAIQMAYDTYPGWCYPPRLNVRDDPTRGLPLRSSVHGSLRKKLTAERIGAVAKFGFRRFVANWLRLFVLLTSLAALMDFPLDLRTARPLFAGLLFLGCVFSVLLVLSSSVFCRSAEGSSEVACRQVRPWICWLILCVFSAPGVSAAMGPSSAEEVRRAAERGMFLLPADRDIRSQTRGYRKVLISRFRGWLWRGHSVSFHGLLNQKPVDAEAISYWLAEYGRELFTAGKAYGQYSETINAVAMMKPIVKRQLASAWDVAFAWLVDEPHQHHPALPLSVLLAVLTVSLSWGWAYVAAVLALAWTGILRIGEVLQSFRSDLISSPRFCSRGHI